MIFEGVPAGHAHIVWREAWACLEPAVRRFPDGPAVEELYRQIQNGTRQLWIAWDGERVIAAVVTEIVQYGTSPVKVCRVPWVGGKRMGDWVSQALSMLKAWARSKDCRFMEGSGRKGWRKYGFEERGLSPVTGLPILVLDLAEA